MIENLLNETNQRNFLDLEYFKLNPYEVSELSQSYQCEECGSYGTEEEVPYYTDDDGYDIRLCEDCAARLGFCTCPGDVNFLHKDNEK